MANTREPSRNPSRYSAYALLLFLCVALLNPPAAFAQSPDLLQAYDVPGSPQAIAIESPSRVWFTLPEEGAIGLLVQADDGTVTVTTHPLPEADSEPYDIAVAGGAVWFTQRAGNRIGRLDAATFALREYDLPVAGSEPTSLAVLTGTDTAVWYTAPGTGRLGRLTVNSALDGSFEEYQLPAGDIAPRPQDVGIQSASRIWVTVPNRSMLYQYQVTTGIFVPVQTGAGSEPWSLAMSGGYPWFTDIAGNRIGSWNPSTLSIIYWRALPHADSRPYGIDAWGGYVWFTEASGQRVGRLSATSFRDLQEFRLPGTSPAPAGIAVDSEGSAWIAAQGADQIMRWQSPYFERTWLPLVFR